jgi:hypothetical protein
MSSLNKEDYNLLGFTKKPNTTTFITELKHKNKIVHTLWQGQVLSDKEKKEHYNAIEIYDVSLINNGHLTSTCDSFLLLICELLQLNITHNYLQQTLIHYNYSKQINTRKTLKFQSTRGHFSCC